MKYTTLGNCPWCDAEQGKPTGWAMNPEAMEELKKRHDNNHPENQPQQTSGNFCPHCGTPLKP